MPRKKEPERVDINRERIIKTAKEQFFKNGVENTKIDTVAKQAGMSKSTLYVYFKSKEEIVDCISLEAMRYLLEQLQKNVPCVNQGNGITFHEQYMAICHVLAAFKHNYPLNFQLLIQEIKVDEESLERNPVLKEIYDCGEQINQYVIRILMGTQKAESRERMTAKIFAQWGSIYGLILLADNKEQYIMKNMHMTKEAFLEQGFEQLYRTMNWEELRCWPHQY